MYSLSIAGYDISPKEKQRKRVFKSIQSVNAQCENGRCVVCVCVQYLFVHVCSCLLDHEDKTD